MTQPIDVIELSKAWSELENGSRAKLRRAKEPGDLLDIPAFYALVSPFGWPENKFALMRMVFCLTSCAITTTDDKTQTLGRALAKEGNISPLRVMQLIRHEWPQDMVQLRRLIIHAEPTLHWPSFAEQLVWWGKYDRRQLLEHFVLSSSK